MKRDDERMTRLHELLLERVEQVVTGEDWTKFLSQSQQFHRYSASNRLLIAAQLIDRGVDPDGLTASYRTWQRIPADGGGTCQVRRGETAMWIYAPLTVTRRVVDAASGDERSEAVGVRGFKTVAVFHQSQLERPPILHEPPKPELLQGTDAPARVWDAMVAELISSGFSVSMERREPGQTWNGQTNFSTREVRVHADLPPQQRLKTMAHEWAHVMLHGGPNAVDRHVAEVEAESVAYLVMGAVGIDAGDYTIPYVSGWAGGSVDIVRSTAERVLAAGGSIVGRLEERLAIDLTPDVLSPRPVEAAALSVVVASERVLEEAVGRLDPLDRVTLLQHRAPEQVAYLLASAGFDTAQAAGTLRDLGVGRAVAETAMTAIYPFAAVDRSAEPLFNPLEVKAAIAGVYGPATRALPEGLPTGVGHGLALLEHWTRMESNPHRPFEPSLAGGLS